MWDHFFDNELSDCFTLSLLDSKYLITICGPEYTAEVRVTFLDKQM